MTDTDYEVEQYLEERSEAIHSDDEIRRRNPSQAEPEFTFIAPLGVSLEGRVDAILAQYATIRQQAYLMLLPRRRQRFLGRVAEEMTRLLGAIADAEIRSAWVAACEFDGIDPDALFVIHSAGNPHVARLSQMVAFIADKGIRPAKGGDR